MFQLMNGERESWEMGTGIFRFKAFLLVKINELKPDDLYYKSQV